MNNTGGLNKMFICPISNLSKDGKIISRDKLINIPFTYDTGERSCSYKEDKKGKYYDLQIKCQIPRSDKAEELTLRFNNDRHERDLQVGRKQGRTTPP